MSDQATTTVDVRTLRRRWKPHKQRFVAQGCDQSTAIRFHRACSWLARYEENEDCDDQDLDLVSLWIAFNALYGQWDEQQREPCPDRETWRNFIDRMQRLDAAGQISATLQDNKRLVISLVDDPYLSSFFWQDPCDGRAGKARQAKFKAQSWFVEQRWTSILDCVLDRIYLMRCQLVHGAATHGSQLNRRSLRRCTTMMHHLITTFLSVWIDHGADEDWGPMCYPPMNRVASNNRQRRKSR